MHSIGQNYSVTSNNMKLVHWPLTGGCYFWYSEDETIGGAAARPGPLAHPSTASVPITIMLHNGPLLCGF